MLLERRSPAHAPYIHALFQQAGFWSLYRTNQNRELSLAELDAALRREFLLPLEELKRIEWIIYRVSRDTNTGQWHKQPVGLSSLTGYHPRHRKAEFLIGIAGAEDRRGWTGLEASLLVLEYAFNTIGLNKLVCLVYGHNPAAQANALRLGFSEEGFLHEHIWSESTGAYADMHQNRLLNTEFRGNPTLAALSIKILGRDITKPAQRRSTAVDIAPFSAGDKAALASRLKAFSHGSSAARNE